jgi:hypothetical protein
MDKGGEEEANEKEAVDQERGNEEEREERKPELQAITSEDDKGEPKGYSGPVSTSTIHATSLKNTLRSIRSSRFLTPVAIQRVGRVSRSPEKTLSHGVG